MPVNRLNQTLVAETYATSKAFGMKNHVSLATNVQLQAQLHLLKLVKDFGPNKGQLMLQETNVLTDIIVQLALLVNMVKLAH